VGIMLVILNKMLWDFLIFSYWGFTTQLEVRDESYELSNVDLEAVTILITLRSLFGLKN